MRALPFDPRVVAIAFLVLAGVGAAVLVVLLVRGAAGALPREEFARQIDRLLRAGNVERALKLCDAAGARPVAVLTRVGLSACLQAGDIPLEGRVEHARMAMSQQLPWMQARALRDVVVALVVAGVVTPIGVVAALLVHDAEWLEATLGAMGVVDLLALVVVPGRLRLRGDLARVVSDFGRGR